MAGLPEPATNKSRNRQFGHPLVVCFFTLFSAAGSRIFLSELLSKRDLPNPD